MKLLTPDQKQYFELNGFLSFGPLISPQRAEQLGQVLDMIAGGDMPYPPELIRWEPVADERAGVTQRKNLVYQIRYPHRHVPLLFEHATDPVILDAVQDLIGPDIVLYNTQALLKPAFHGTSQPWHQDSAYWPIRPFELVTCWIALDEATRENGCMHFLPGSHLEGLREHVAGRPLSAASGAPRPQCSSWKSKQTKASPCLPRSASDRSTIA
jgi:phytanoyl-CoA hydroxylase